MIFAEDFNSVSLFEEGKEVQSLSKSERIELGIPMDLIKALGGHKFNTVMPEYND